MLALTLALVSVPSFASADTEHEHHHGASEPLTSSELDVLAEIDADTIVDHIRYVENEIGSGVAGSPAELRRAEYFAGQLEDLGYAQWSHATATDGEDDYFQFFEDPVVASGVTGSLTLNGREYPVTGPSDSDTGVYRGSDQPEITGGPSTSPRPRSWGCVARRPSTTPSSRPRTTGRTSSATTTSTWPRRPRCSTRT
ncbi:MAG: hypothetical protein ACTMIR_01135 [Cellulomonadaceae bacterium]